MRLILWSIVPAALAPFGSAAPTFVAGEAITTTELPARFAMYLVAEEPRANGLRIGYANSVLQIKINVDEQQAPFVEGFFFGGRGRIALDRTVHKVPNSNSPTNPEPWGDWNVSFQAGLNPIQVESEQSQAKWEGWGRPLTVGRWVQDSNGILRLLNSDGVLQPNGLRLCGEGKSHYALWWDEMLYLPCPVVELKIKAL